MPDFDHDPEALAWAERAVAEAQRAALLSLAEFFDEVAEGCPPPPNVAAPCWASAAGVARQRAGAIQRAAAIPDPQVQGEPPAQQAHPASSGSHTATSEPTGARPGTDESGWPSDDLRDAPEAIPEEWVAAAKDHYSMHGSGLIRNILSGVAPLIRADERERCAAEVRAKADELDGNVTPDPELSRSFTAGMRRAAGYIVHGEYPPAANPDASPDAATWMAPDEP